MSHKIKTAHQFYRDVFTKAIHIEDIGRFNKDLAKEIFSGKVCISSYFSIQNTASFPDKRQAAINGVMLALTLANSVLDVHFEGRQVRLHRAYTQNISEIISTALQQHKNTELLTASIQILFRVGEIEYALELINKNADILRNISVIHKILLLTSIMDEDYYTALPIIQGLTSNPDMIGNDPLTLLMIVSVIHKCGGIPEDFIDFRSLHDTQPAQINYEYKWISKKKTHSGKLTAVIACNPEYYFEHALPLLFSINETNSKILDVHFHLYNPSQDILDDILARETQFPDIQISITSETIYPENITRYASHRFIFCNAVLTEFNNPILILDADMLLRQQISHLEEIFSAHDIVLTQTDSSPFWEKALAGFVYLSGKPAAAQYLEKVARFLSTNLEKGLTPWFLDQVALSAALDTADPADVGRIDSSLVCDTTHLNNSIIWTTTTHKQAGGGFSEYKNYLISKYGNPLLLDINPPHEKHTKPAESSPDLKDNSEAIEKEKNQIPSSLTIQPISFSSKGFFDFIEIGTSDFDTQIQRADETTRGISIDPVGQYLDRLPSPPNCIKMKAAISDCESETDVYYIDSNQINKLRLPSWIRGCNSIGKPHPAVLDLLSQKSIPFDDVVSVDRITTHRLIKIYEDFNIENVYLLKIDTEGHDKIIIKDFFASSNNSQWPQILIFESNGLINSEDFHSLLSTLTEKGYDIVSISRHTADANTILQLNLNRIKKTGNISFAYPGCSIENITSYQKSIYPLNYDPNNPPHENTWQSAIDYAQKIGASGVTMKNSKFEVRCGDYIIKINSGGSIAKQSSWAII